MPVLTPQQRNTLESAVKHARKVAEQGAYNALHAMAVDHPEPFAHMDATERSLRNSLRSKARLLGDELNANSEQAIHHLSYELAYETWHKMLFAKFLEANHLLMHPDGVAVTMEDCEELGKEEGYADKWDAAANYASRMLPAIFRVDDPLMKVGYATDDRIKLESIIEGLENSIFTADDALGWVYQFWQSEAKATINASGDKIDGEKLPAVTQLFTEPYMVHFLIDNTLGAWWVSRNPGVKPPVKFEYLRFANVAPASSRSNNQYDFFSQYEEVNHIKGNLPHWRQEGKIYFVTFRTADSMPQEKLKEWQEELDAWKAKNPEPLSQEQKKEYYKRFPAKMQEYLDAGHGACHLKYENVRLIVENALKFFDGERYILDEYVVAANHVHALLTPKEDHQLSDIFHSWKSFTANEINKVTGEKGAFWQKESFDHLVRSEASLEKFREYIRNHYKDNLRQDGGATLENTFVPAAGKFEGWPDSTAEVTALDPCMGSGHFVASLFPVFAALRMQEEGLSKEEATDKVIAENLHGLELDARCTQIAAFNLALTAWKFCGQYKELPEMNLACSGIAPKGKMEDWIKLVSKEPDAEKKQRLENGMEQLYKHFQLAPELGSLLDPTTIKSDPFMASFEELQPVLKRALENEADTEQLERGVMAAGIAKAGQLLGKRYTLQITNVPYLGKGKFDQVLSDYVMKYYTDAKGDLATVFMERLFKTAQTHGTITTVIPQNWLFLTTYKKYREKLLKNETWNMVARLGAGAFSQISGEVVKAILISLSHTKPTTDQPLVGLDVSEAPNAAAKDEALKTTELKTVKQLEQLGNPDTVVAFENIKSENLLNKFSYSHHGLTSGDLPQMSMFYWELGYISDMWIPFQTTTKRTQYYGGLESMLRWEKGKGAINKLPGARKDGTAAWGRKGVVISQMGEMPATIYFGSSFDNNTAVITPNNDEHFEAIWSFCSSPKYNEAVRKIDQSLAVTSGTMAKIPFDLEHWQKVASDKYPNGLPKPYSDDPTQWLFHGHPIKTDKPLQVALARMLGYRWPAEKVDDASSVVDNNPLSNNAAGSSVYDTLADEAKELIEAVKAFDQLSDEDGIFCIPSVNTEQGGAERLRDFLQEVFKEEWSSQTINQLLQKEGANATNLEAWLRDEFFVQHCKVFQNRPFIWHMWDGRKDGFSVLVNYHKLTKDNLSKLVYTYLGDWIRMCEAKKKASESGAEGLLSAAQKLKEKLEAILEGEAPYDIFVRWKPLEQQPIGWEPDLNDGVRLNIRPFIEADVLRKKPNIKWGVDRGKNPPGSYWGEIRDNDKHLGLEEKRAARERMHNS